ncbi:hypothetical protein F5X68DRAFT_254856 [Plectosphaerella plurivora]|uniref:N-acetyltransferase domain-containing protein n=1 Tax=Plectosphaerella plurivora TaxID=936078 RepID=A0A9P8VE78_9PEZI|nr:hypothetical protein F5X68DRAFT_254856 [Plectosphaerella plurivora]
MENSTPDPVLLWDRQQALPLGRELQEDDLLLLLTPVAVPIDSSPYESRDPFEPLGRALSSFHPAVRHVPYTKGNGITADHKVWLQRCGVIVFVMSGPPDNGDPSQADMALTALHLCRDAVFVVIACFDCLDYDLPLWKLPTVLQVQEYTTIQLQTAAHFFFDISDHTPYSTFQDVSEISPRRWQVETCNFNVDMTTIYDLWHLCLPDRFRISQSVLGSLLNRASILCLVVRQPITGEVLGSCAILAPEEDLAETPRYGSLAALMVRKEYRGRGIGMSLHDSGIHALMESSGVQHIRLGSTFPRLLHGIPLDSRFGGWFTRRGWHGEAAPQALDLESSDWLLELGHFAEQGLSMAGLSFQRCTPSDRDRVLNLVSRVSRRKGNLGWISQYTRLADSNFISDIIVGFEGATVISAAILYKSSVDHPFAQDMPWAQSIGTNVGGLSCICIIDQVPGMVNNRVSIMTRLLDYCVKTLAGDGCKYMFLDAVRGGDHGLPELGFRQWSRYTDLWKHIPEVKDE